jgi:proline iminopeptidase
VDDLSSADEFVDERYNDDRFRLAFARQVTHCWAADSWLSQDELILGARTMADVPATLVHGARDRSSPLEPVQRLHDAWPHSRLLITDDGHGGDDMWYHVADSVRAAAECAP